MKEYNWAVLGTGVIANETATAMAKTADDFMQSETERTKRLLLLPKNTE